MELEVKKRMSQLHIQQGIGIGIIICAVVYFIYTMYQIDSYYLAMAFGRPAALLVIASICMIYILLVVIGALVMRLGSVRITSILAKECDPYLYEACISRNRQLFFKDRLLCALALAQHYQGDYDRAWTTLQEINVHKLRGTFCANYYILLSDQYFKRGMGLKVRDLEEAYRLRVTGKRSRKYFEMLCAGNNLTRAFENQDYQAAAGFLQKRMELDGNVVHIWMRVCYAYKEAQIFLGLGEKESAKMKLRYVAGNGGRLWSAREARRMLGEMEEEAKQGGDNHRGCE